MKSWITLFFLLVLVSTLGYTQVTNKLDNLQVGTLTTKTLDVTSTTKASKPCPKMSLVERDAIASPLEGQCVYNSTAKTLNLYDGSAWVEVAGTGGEGGIANWEQNKFYDVYDVVIYNLKIYQCQIQHTSTTTFDESKFLELANDVSSSTGVLSLTNGGTNKALTPSDQGVVFSDADSLEILPKGANRSVLKIGDTGDLSFGDIDFSDLQGTLSDGQIDSPVSLSKGGTNNALTAQDKAIVYSDADSLELLAPGTEGQVLKMGALAPEWGNAGVSVSNNYATATELSKLTVPNEVLTEQATGEYYLEKNNNNILSNPSFEGSFPGLWSINVSSDQFGTGAIDGGYTLRALPSSQIVEILQDSSLYVDAFADGSVQGMASARIKTSIAGVKLCPRKAAVTQTSLCVTHTGSGKWEHLKVPFILGDTSNGLVILTDSAVSGTIYIDDAFVGAVDLSATQSFDTTCDTIACATEFSIKVSGAGATISENVDWASSSRIALGDYRVNFNSGIFTLAPTCVVTTSEAGHYVDTQIDALTNTQMALIIKDSATTTFRDKKFEVVCQKQGADYTAALQAQKDYQKTKVTSYSSTNADTDWNNVSNVSAGTFITATTTSPTFGTVAVNKAQWKRQGSDLLLRWDFRRTTAGTAGSGGYLINIPAETGCKIDLTKAPATPTINTGELSSYKNSNVGTFYYSDSSNDGVGHIFPYTETQLAAAFIYAGTASASAWWGSTSGAMSTPAVQAINIDARIPCQNWQNSNIIIGQFNGLEKCESTLDCTDTFSAKVSAAGVVSDENVDWLDGNATITDTSKFSMVIKSEIFSVTPNCYTSMASDVSAVSQSAVVDLASTTPVQVRVRTLAGGGKSAQPFTIVCQKQGADYVGKTAKAVASDQNTRSVGVTNSVLYSAVVSALTGAVSAEFGDFINGNCTSGSTKTCSINANAITSGVCVCSVSGTFGECRAGISGSTLTILTANSAGTASDQSASIICHGVK